MNGNVDSKSNFQSRQHLLEHKYRDDGCHYRSAEESLRAFVHKPCIWVLFSHECMGLLSHQWRIVQPCC